MILVLFNALTNIIVVWVVLLLPAMVILPKHVSINTYEYICISVELLLLVIGISKYGYVVVKFLQGYRKLTQREINYIKPLFDEVIQKQNTIYKTSYKWEDFKIFASDIKEPNAYAFGSHCIIVTTGFLNFANADEVKAVLAHEMGHLWHRDSLTLVANVWVGLPTLICFKVALTLYKLAKLANEFKSPTLFEAAILIPFLLFLPYAIIGVTVHLVINLIFRLMSKRTEYRADYHSFKLGYQASMITILEKFNQINEHDNSFFANLFATHPAPLLRIDKLEKHQSLSEEQASKNLAD